MWDERAAARHNTLSDFIVSAWKQYFRIGIIIVSNNQLLQGFSQINNYLEKLRCIILLMWYLLNTTYAH